MLCVGVRVRVSLHGVCFAMVCCALSTSVRAQGACETLGGTFPKWGTGGAPVIKIFWQSFADQNIAIGNQTYLENAVKETIERWKAVSAANVRPTYGGIVNTNLPGANEVIIRMSAS